MPAKKNKDTINLLPSEEFKTSILGRILRWALTTFRVMVIVCEMIVMGAFLSRFWLDARNSDLNDEIKLAKSKITAFKPVEDEFRGFQKRLLVAKELYAQDKSSDLVDELSRNLPSEVYLVSIIKGSDSVQISATSTSEQAILQYIVNLEASDMVKSVTLSQVSTDKENAALVSFLLTLETK